MSAGDGFPATKAARSLESNYLSPPYANDASATKNGAMKDSTSPADSLLDLYGQNKPTTIAESNKRAQPEPAVGEVNDDSKWIHRDKLARIESEELQAAGIILPKPRQPLKVRRDKSSDKLNGYKKSADPLVEVPLAQQQAQPTGRPRKDSANSRPKTPEPAIQSWDLRLPEEILAEANGYWVTNGGTKGTSRIPVAKISPVPVPPEFLERDTPMMRRQSGLTPGDEETIVYPKPSRTRSNSLRNGEPALTPTTSNGGATKGPQAKRSVTDTSPKKAAAGSGQQGPTAGAAGQRKTSAPAKGPPGSRPKTRSGPNKDSTSSSSGASRPVTRSGELSPTGLKGAPEGEPPWMVSAYRPDPRLPPDQQLLPTVARRLQQEKWEREGKFGNIYDREFRPLTDEGFLDPPPAPDKAQQQPAKDEQHHNDEWPLKADNQQQYHQQQQQQPWSGPRSPTTPRPGTSSYSTMPKIQDKPHSGTGGSGRPNSAQRGPLSGNPTGAQEVRRQPEPLEEALDRKKGCGCCVVM